MIKWEAAYLFMILKSTQENIYLNVLKFHVNLAKKCRNLWHYVMHEPVIC